MLVVPALLGAGLVACVPRTDGPPPRDIRGFDAGWRFQLSDDSAARDVAYDDSGWRTLDLPHDWSIEGPFAESNPAGAGGGALPGGVAWYRKTFTLPAEDEGRFLSIEFDGVYRNSEVWVNGEYLGKRPYGYSSFRYDLTPYVSFGEPANVVAVRVDNSAQPNSRWYSGSGIYRHVRLVLTDSVHVAPRGTWITTPEVTPERALVTVRTTVRNASRGPRPVTVRTALHDESGREAAAATSQATIPADSTLELAQALEVSRPALWSPAQPKLYRAVTRVDCGERVCDEVETTVGIRTAVFDTERGFLLNGERLEIRGVNLHHDLGALGAALNERALERQLEIMKGMGANAIRTSHNPPAPELLDLADRMGFLVMDEAFDVWRMAKTPYDYHLDFDEWHERDLADMVLRDRNHPSVVAWSIGNEVREQGDSSGARIAVALAAIVRRLDPTRPVAAGLDQLGPWNFVIASGALDIVGYNYRHHLWADHPKTFPGTAFLATEAASALATRGHYEQPSDSVARYGGEWLGLESPPANPDYRLSAYDHRAAAWGSTHEESLREIRKAPLLAGLFVWTGFDYLGEPTPYGWPARSSYFGIVDLAGFPKDAYWLYQSEWTSDPVLHVFPHWSWQPGDTIDVWAYTNLDTVALSLNGVSLGARTKAGGALHVQWRVPWEPGVLRAVGRKSGRDLAMREVRTAGAAARVALEPDRASLRADGRDLSFVTVSVVDSAGVVVPAADASVRFGVEGPARIAGVDNGDAASHAPFQADSVRLSSGKALVILRAGRDAGVVTLTATSEGLAGGRARIELAPTGRGAERR
jgi:beta-galactosidase